MIESVQAVRPRPCPVCGNEDDGDVVAGSNVDVDRLTALSFASRKTPEYMHHRYVRCPECSLVYVTPAPAEDALLDAYDDAAFDAGAESRLAALTYVRLLDRIEPGRRAGGVLVDVGAGDGAFLAAAADAGFADRIGFEPSAAPIRAAPPESRPLLRHEPFVAGSLPAGSAAVVTCFQTIEHVDDPLGLCRAAHDLLVPDGALVLVCHDAAALPARVMGTRSPIYDIEHLQLFQRRSVAELVRRAGFRRVRIGPVVNEYPLAYWAKLAPLPAKARVLELLDRTGIGRLPVRMAAGNLAVTAWR